MEELTRGERLYRRLPILLKYYCEYTKVDKSQLWDEVRNLCISRSFFGTQGGYTTPECASYAYDVFWHSIVQYLGADVDERPGTDRLARVRRERVLLSAMMLKGGPEFRKLGFPGVVELNGKLEGKYSTEDEISPLYHKIADIVGLGGKLEDDSFTEDLSVTGDVEYLDDMFFLSRTLLVELILLRIKFSYGNPSTVWVFV